MSRIKVCQLFLMFVSLSLTASAAISAGEVRVLERKVSLRVLTFNDPQNPLLVGSVYTSTVVDGIEFGAGREGRSGLDVVPVIVDVEQGRIEFFYQMIEIPSIFATANFNGYELSFEPCIRFENIAVASEKSISMDNTRVWSVDNRIYVNVSSLNYTQNSSFSVSFDAVSCPIS